MKNMFTVKSSNCSIPLSFLDGTTANGHYVCLSVCLSVRSSVCHLLW